MAAIAPTKKKRKTPPGRALFKYDCELGFRGVVGADEAGRGCLAGPLVTAAVLFDQELLTGRARSELEALNDSKKLTVKAREELYPVVLRHATAVAVVSRCAPGVDRRGLHRSNLAALREALLEVACPGCVCLSDGYAVEDLPYEQRAIKRGDSTSAAIAAASVIAKVTRDRYMQRAEQLHPGYGFCDHVGYATPEHHDAIEREGLSPLHRRSFNSVAYTQLSLG